jgi:hypothetical protein
MLTVRDSRGRDLLRPVHCGRIVAQVAADEHGRGFAARGRRKVPAQLTGSANLDAGAQAVDADHQRLTGVVGEASLPRPGRHRDTGNRSCRAGAASPGRAVPAAAPADGAQPRARRGPALSGRSAGLTGRAGQRTARHRRSRTMHRVLKRYKPRGAPASRPPVRPGADEGQESRACQGADQGFHGYGGPRQSETMNPSGGRSVRH